MIDVTSEVFADFFNYPDLDSQHGLNYWNDETDDMEKAAEQYGKVVAYYDNSGTLYVVDEELYNSRKQFYLGE